MTLRRQDRRGFEVCFVLLFGIFFVALRRLLGNEAVTPVANVLVLVQLLLSVLGLYIVEKARQRCLPLCSMELFQQIGCSHVGVLGRLLDPWHIFGPLGRGHYGACIVYLVQRTTVACSELWPKQSRDAYLPPRTCRLDAGLSTTICCCHDRYQ
jgi:hypothetical protein